MGQKILLVEDSATQALEVKLQLERKGFLVEVARDGKTGLEKALSNSFDLILLDYHLPGLSGLDILGGLQCQNVKTPVVMITGSTDVRVAVETMKHGAADYVVKDQNYALTLLPTIERVLEKHRLRQQLEAAQAALKEYAENLEKMVARRTEQLEASYNSTLDALVAALDAREHETQNHSQRVATRTAYLARRLGVDDGQIPTIAQGALMHDIGKIGVPDPILLKPGPLSSEEWVIMKKHPDIGYNILNGIEFLQEAREIVLSHQERYDGSGYPRGMRREEIPLGARIFAVIDAFDAITNDRPYRKGRPYAAAREEIVRGAGTQFDPEIARAFLSVPEPEWHSLSGAQAALTAALRQRS
ncbi:MAG TPA: HD domain-containing phosphohydrolase [Candidatus Acidoferrales bacterium]|nr:HD domain-containing phosphohydrolase [Candidatus Acidoferrales bacterium]